MITNDIFWEDTHSFFNKGISTDLLWAQIHYFIYHTLGENAEEINKRPKSYEKSKIAYLQITSHELALLALARIFERKSKDPTIRTRCLETVIQECKAIASNHFPLEMEYYPYLPQLTSLSGVPFPDDALNRQNELIRFLKAVLGSRKVRSAVDNLMMVRKKVIAHNEHIELPLMTSFWDDYILLISIARLNHLLISRIFLDTHYNMDEEILSKPITFNAYNNAYWIVEYLGRFIGKGKVVDFYQNWNNE